MIGQKMPYLGLGMLDRIHIVPLCDNRCLIIKQNLIQVRPAGITELQRLLLLPLPRLTL